MVKLDVIVADLGPGPMPTVVLRADHGQYLLSIEMRRRAHGGYSATSPTDVLSHDVDSDPSHSAAPVWVGSIQMV
jgi:hypothetical protein